MNMKVSDTVKRWGITTDRNGAPSMSEDDFGSWVLFSELQPLLARYDEVHTALKNLSDFYAVNDTREGHTNKCNRWNGAGCTCGGTRVRDAAKIGLG